MVQDVAGSPPRRPLLPVEAALVAEACSRGDVMWIRPAGETRYRAVWHVWHDDAACLVLGGGEQSLPRLVGEVEAIARSKESGAQVVRFRALVHQLTAGTPEWQAAATALAAARLNASDPAGQRDRWAAGSMICLLRPTALRAAVAGADDSPSGSAPPPGGPGTTLTRRPFHLRGRRRRRRGIT